MAGAPRLTNSSGKHHEAALTGPYPFLLSGRIIYDCYSSNYVENPIDFIENSDLSSINVNETNSGSILPDPPTFNLTQPRLNHFGITLSLNRKSTIFRPNNRPVPRNNRSSTDPIANSTCQSSASNPSNSTAQPSKKRGRPSNPDPSWFEERDGGFWCSFCINNHVVTDCGSWVSKPCINKVKQAAIRKHRLKGSAHALEEERQSLHQTVPVEEHLVSMSSTEIDSMKQLFRIVYHNVSLNRPLSD